jgi:23S rRNA pseudouridine1911/1915/1917 synthase
MKHGMTDREVKFRYTDSEPARLDKFLVSQMTGYSRARLQTLIRSGLVYIDELPASKTGQILEAGMQVAVYLPPPEPTTLVPEDIPLDIVYEDENLLVVNKPAGMVVHPSAGHHTGTLVHAVLAHAPEMEGLAGEKRPGVVHRLDKDTSGLILFAKNDATHRWLQEQFRRRLVQKYYIALVDGHPPTSSGRVEAAIGRDPRQHLKMAVVPDQQGRLAASEYHTLESFTQHTLLDVRPITGRTHQIRLHMAFINCPIAGDRVYGRRRASINLERHFLHARRLDIRLLGEKLPGTFEAPMPDELEQILENLRKQS